jgi:hypothetical protein
MMVSTRNPVMHDAQQRLTYQPWRKEPDPKPPVPDRVKMGLDAPTTITGTDVLAIAKALRSALAKPSNRLA